MDDYVGATYTVWASTPAILWTNKRPQEEGIHVHMKRDGKWLVDETFASVIFEGKELDRSELFAQMVAHVDVSNDALPVN